MWTSWVKRGYCSLEEIANWRYGGWKCALYNSESTHLVCHPCIEVYALWLYNVIYIYIPVLSNDLGKCATSGIRTRLFRVFLIGGRN